MQTKYFTGNPMSKILIVRIIVPLMLFALSMAFGKMLQVQQNINKTGVFNNGVENALEETSCFFGTSYLLKNSFF